MYFSVLSWMNLPQVFKSSLLANFYYVTYKNIKKPVQDLSKITKIVTDIAPHSVPVVNGLWCGAGVHRHTYVHAGVGTQRRVPPFHNQLQPLSGVVRDQKKRMVHTDCTDSHFLQFLHSF